MKKVMLSDGKSLTNIRLDATFRTVGKDMYQLLVAKRAFGVRSRLVNQTDYQIYAS